MRDPSQIGSPSVPSQKGMSSGHARLTVSVSALYLNGTSSFQISHSQAKHHTPRRTSIQGSNEKVKRSQATRHGSQNPVYCHFLRPGCIGQTDTASRGVAPREEIASQGAAAQRPGPEH